MPVRNAQRFVEAGVRSVLAQSHANFELPAIDDASTDATPQILDRLASIDGRIRVLRDGRLGLVGALNRGLAEARAALVARMDADDVAMPRRFELQMAALAAAPQLGVIGGQAQTALVEAKTAIDDARVGGVGSARRRHRVPSRLLRAALAQRRPVLTATLVRQMWREDPWRTLPAPWRRVKVPGLD